MLINKFTTIYDQFTTIFDKFTTKLRRNIFILEWYNYTVLY